MCIHMAVKVMTYYDGTTLRIVVHNVVRIIEFMMPQYGSCSTIVRVNVYFLILISWGTGMIASSSTFCPNPGRVIRDLLRQLHAVWHGTEALVYSNHPREAAASSYLAIIFGRIASGVAWFLHSTAVLMQLLHQCWRWCRLW